MIPVPASSIRETTPEESEALIDEWIGPLSYGNFSVAVSPAPQKYACCSRPLESPLTASPPCTEPRYLTRCPTVVHSTYVYSSASASVRPLGVVAPRSSSRSAANQGTDHSLEVKRRTVPIYSANFIQFAAGLLRRTVPRVSTLRFLSMEARRLG